jgi:hypothetical protein
MLNRIAENEAPYGTRLKALECATGMFRLQNNQQLMR